MKFVYPLERSYTITQRFGENVEYYRNTFGIEGGHNGVDYGAPEGVKVMAAATGVVRVAGFDNANGGGYGLYVIVDHTDGYQTRYAHLSSCCVVVGQDVRAGDPIGKVGWTGNVIPTGPAGAHLHLEIRKDNQAVDPLPLLGDIFQPGQVVHVKTDCMLNIREGPAITFRSLGVLQGNTPLEVSRVDGDWLLVTLTAWVHGGYVE